MSTKESPSLNNNRKLTASFSSPEFNESSLLSSSSMEGTSESLTSAATTTNTTNNNVAESLTSNTHLITTSNSNSMITSNTASQIISGAGIKLNTTRDSGFSDSLIEDSTTSSSNSTQFLTRSEHLVNTLIDAKIPPSSSSPVKLNSVDEDMHITNDEKDDELSKEFITIVKTTKVTTKVKHIKNPAKNKKNKKQKQQKGVVEQQHNIIDENKQLAEIVTEIITENESVLSANITGSNNLYTNGNIQSTSKTSKSIIQTTSSSNGDNNTYDKIEEDEERTSNSAESNTNEIYDEEDEEDNQIAELNGINKSKSKNRKQKEDDTIIKLNINKSTEELVFQGLPPSTIIKTKEESLTTYSNNNTTTTNNTQQLLSTTMSSDLNTSILDSEELLSDYSTVQNPNQLETTLNKTNDLNASLTSSSIKEIPNVIDFVLNDVTNNEVKPVVQVSNETKNDNKKKKKFNLFKSKSNTTTTTADSKRKLSKKDTDLVQESPSKQAKISKETAKNILSLYDHNSLSTIKHRILDEEQKDRIIYMKPECVDVLLNYFVQFESNSNSKTQLTNLKNQPYLSVALKKMIARSLDLLRHDKIETFDKLAAQLKQEYKISDLNEDEIVDENFDFNNVNSVTNDLIFKQLIQEALIHNRILLSIYLDKSKCQPYEEIIEFNNNKLINNNLPVVINKPIQTPQIEEEQEQDLVNKTEPEIIEVELKQTPPVEKEEVEVVVLKKESFEVKQEPIEIIQKQSEYESRIVLDTIKEPPIVFPSELDPSILSRPIIQSKVVETNQQQEEKQQPTVSQSENKNKTKVKKIKKSSNKKTNSGISCIVCGTSSMKKSEEDLNKLTEIPIPIEEEKIIQSSKPPTEHLQQSVDLEAVNQVLFTNLDSKSSEIKVEEEQQKDLKTEDIEKIKVSLEKLDLNDKQEQQLAVNNEIEKTTLTPPSTPEELNNLNQKEQIVEIIQPVIQLTDPKTTKKNKKQKKQKTQVTNEIHLSSTGLVDISVLDIKIEANLDSVPKEQPIVESEKELEQTNPITVEQPTAATTTTNTDPIKIDIKNIQMENEKTELERKSFSEIIEITHTFVSNLEKDNDIKIGSNLDIKTEIDIGIEKEILKEEQVQLIEKQEKEEKEEQQEQETQQVKPPLSDDIVKLPERDESQLVSPLAVINTTTTTTTKVEVEATKPTKKEKKTPTSCFSCKAKKAKKETNIAKKQTEQVKTVTPSLAVAEEESKTQVVIKEPTPLNINSTGPIHGNLFVGLDRRSSEQPLDVPSIYTIEMNEKQQTDSTKSHIGSIEKEEKLITPSLVGSTSIEETQNENNNKVIQSDLIAEVQVEDLEKNIQLEIQTTNQTEITELHIEDQLVEDKPASDLVAPPTDAAKEETVKVLSDDPVVLPEPSENVFQQPKVNSEIEIAKKEIESQDKPDNKKVKNKKSTKSCFPKKQKKVVASPQIKEEKEETKIKAEPAESTQTKVTSAPVLHAENKIIENWSIGLDRKDDDIVLRKEPIDYISVVSNEKLIHKEEEKPTEEIIVSTEKVEEVTVDESQKLDENLPQSELIINEIDVKSNLKEGSWVVIDRQPDHAVIPIVNNQENVPQQLQKNQPSSLVVLDTASKVETTTAKIEEKPAKIKTSRIDLPLINLCAPRSKKDKKSKTKVKKTIKNDVTVLTLDTPEQPSASIITNEISKIQPPIIESEQTIELEVKAIIDEAIKQIEHTTITEKPNEKIDEPVVHIKLDRIPDIVSLPEPSLDANTKTLAVKVKTTETKLEQPAVIEISTKSEKKEQKRTTSIFDMPLIDILVPNESKKHEKSEKKLKKKNNKQTSASNVESTKKKEQIPELLIIDVPTLDIVKSQPDTPVKKQEKVENFNIEIPVTATSVENLDIKLKEESQLKSQAKEEQEENLPIITSELKIETITEEITKTEELVATSNVNEIDKTDETGSWIIIERQSDHAVLPTVEVIQQTTVEQPITPIIEVKPIEEVKITKIVKTSKKPISCFSCRAKNSKSKKETVKKDEPVVATETKTVEKVEVKPIVPVQTEFNYDFTGLDRRDSQEPLKKDPEPEQLKVEQESLQPETEKIVVEPLKTELKEEIVELTIKDEPQVLEINENSEKLVSEEFNKADNSVFTTTEVIQQSTVEEPISPLIETKPIEESNKEDNNVVLPAIETTEVIQQTTVEQPITPIIEVKPIEEVKITKIVKTSKKPISCFSCRAKNSKSKKETVKKDEPVVATETKTVEKVEVKPIVPVQTEFNYDFTGLDRRDSQEPLKKDPEPEQITTVIDLTIKNEPQVLETNENIEKIIKEELNEVDKQYPELNKVVETTVTIENEQLKSCEEEDPTKSLDEILEKAEIELKKFDESLDIKPLKEAETEQLVKEQETQQVKPPLSDDIVKLPERDESQLVSPLAVINTTTTTTTKVEVEATKPTKKEKKTPTSCFSCKAKKAKDNKEISNLTPKTQYVNIETKTEPIAQPINDKPAVIVSDIKYDPDLFKGLDRAEDVPLIKKDLEENLDSIRVERSDKPQNENTSEIIFNEVIQEIIVETSALQQPVKEEEKVQTTQEKEPELVIETIKKDLEKTLEVSAAVTPRVLSDDPVVLPEPPVRTQTHIITQKFEATPISTGVETEKKAKKPGLFASLICSGKTKAVKKNKSLEKSASPASDASEIKSVDKPVDLEIKTPLISAQPPKKPPRGHLDTSVVDNDIETLIPTNFIEPTAIIETKLVEETKTPTTIVNEPTNIVLDVSHVLIDPQITQPLQIEIQNPNVSLVQEIKTNEVLSNNSLLTESKLQTSKSESTLNKVLEVPNVIDLSSNVSKRITTWTTDPLPHVQIGSHRINFSETEVNNLVRNEQKTVSPVKTEPEISPKVGITAITTNLTSETLKKLTKEEIKLFKSKKNEAIDYLAQKLGYSKSSSNTRQDKEKLKVVNKLFKKCIKTLLKNDSITYSNLNKKLEKEVSSKKYSTEINQCLDQFKQEITSESLFHYLKHDKQTLTNLTETEIPKQQQQQQQQQQIKTLKTNDLDSGLKQKSSSDEKLDKFSDQQPVMKRFPSLTWREANERARILFYKGRVPSIHYNEKRDSFRVSMITSVVNTNGIEKTTEVPVCDDDVRRLLNSCGLYWNGESISLLNKSDDIFSIAQQEAFDILQLINSSN
jgi:hypothetical protein